MVHLAEFKVSQDNPVYWFSDAPGNQWALARLWHHEQEKIEIFLVDRIAQLDSEGKFLETAATGAFPDGEPVLSEGWSLQEIASVLARLPGRRTVCIWNTAPFPPGSIDSEEVREIPQEDIEHDSSWHTEHAKEVFLFPSQMRSRSPRDEIIRHWWRAYVKKGYGETRIYYKAMSLEDRPLAKLPCQDVADTIRDILFDEPQSISPTLRGWPITTCLVNRELTWMGKAWMGEEWISSHSGGVEFKARTDFIEREITPLAVASLQGKVAQDQPKQVVELAARVLLLLGKPADMAALTHIDSLDLREWVITDSCLDCLVAMPWLKRLDLSHCLRSCGAKGLQKLSVLVGLKQLALAGLDVRNTETRWLLTLNHLENLDLSKNYNFSDGGLSPLFRLPSLRRLDLRFNPISNEAHQNLRQRLPDCDILFEQSQSIPLE